MSEHAEAVVTEGGGRSALPPRLPHLVFIRKRREAKGGGRGDDPRGRFGGTW